MEINISLLKEGERIQNYILKTGKEDINSDI